MFDEKNNSSPEIVGYFSVTSDRKFEQTASSLRYFKLPDLSEIIDLSEGYDSSYKNKPETYFDEKMDNLLSYIVSKKKELVNKKDNIEKGTPLIPSTKYLIFRGLITKILYSPYECSTPWNILATKYKKNIYLCLYSTQEQREKEQNRSMYEKKCIFFGAKYEQCCLVDDPSKSPDTSKPVDGSSQFFAVYQRQLVGRNFLFGAEMDGIVSETKVDLNNPNVLKNLKFIELKTSIKPKTNYNFKRYKSLSIWIQSYLTGVDDIYVGNRNKNGGLVEILPYNRQKLKECGKEYWDLKKCFEFLDSFLTNIEKKLENVDCSDSVYYCTLNTDTKDVKYVFYEGKNEFSFLKDWYLNEVNS